MLISELGYGGAEGAFLRLAAAFAEAGHEVELAVFQARYRAADYTAADIAVPHPLHVLDDQDRATGLERWRRRSARLRRLKQKLRPDAVISFLSGPNLLNAVTGGPGLKLVSIRGSRRYGSHMGAASRWLYRHLVDPVTHRLADGIVGCSEGITYEVSNSSPTRPPPAKFQTIAGYADADRLIAAAGKPLPTEWEALRGLPIICGVGRIAFSKGFHHLIRLLPQIRLQHPEARLLLIGDGPQLGELKQRCTDAGLSWSEEPDRHAAVIFAGYQPDAASIASVARLLVVSSDAEGLPNVMLEALAAGLPIMAGDIPWGVREVLGVPADPLNRPYPRTTAPLGTDFGWLMPRIDDPANDQVWVDQIVLALEEGSDPAERIARAHERVRSFDVRRAARRWTDLIAQLQAARR